MSIRIRTLPPENDAPAVGVTISGDGFEARVVKHPRFLTFLCEDCESADCKHVAAVKASISP